MPCYRTFPFIIPMLLLACSDTGADPSAGVCSASRECDAWERCVDGACVPNFVSDAGVFGSDASGARHDAAMDAEALPDPDAAVGSGEGCEVGATRACSEVDPALAGVGACGLGTQTCVRAGEFGGRWDTCTGWTGPVAEVCGDGVDDDCDGTPDQSCDYRWDVSAFSACSSTCGDGTQARTVRCIAGATGEEVDATFCTASAPETTQPCTDASGCRYSAWSDWSTCAASSRSQTRTCVDAAGQGVDCTLCGGLCRQTEACNPCAMLSLNVVHGGGLGPCNAVLSDRASQCRAAGCSWRAPAACTIGGSPSSATAYGAQGTCF